MKIDRKDLMVAALLAGLTIVAFWPVADCQFINYDDTLYVTSNSEVQQGLSWHGVSWAMTATDAANWHPITWLSHMADVQAFGASASGHHLTSLWIHLLNVLLLFLALRLMTGCLWPSAFVAELFAVHPLNVESVAWVAERKSVLSTLFWLLTIGAYIWYAAQPGWRRYTAVAVSFILALMCKPMVVTLPFVLLLLDYWPLRRYDPRASGDIKVEAPSDTPVKATVMTVKAAPKTKPITSKNRAKSAAARLAFRREPAKRLILEKTPFLILAIASSIITVIAQRKGGALTSTEAFPIGIRVENAVVSYGAYLEHMFYPAGLAVFYPHPKSSLAIWQVAACSAILLAITALVVAGARRFKYLPVGWFWYLGTMVPVIGLVQVGAQARADRYAYIPLIGLFIIVAFGLFDLRKRIRPSLAVALAAVAVMVLTVITRNQIGYWKNSAILFAHAASITSDNYVAYNNLGEALAQEGKLDDALDAFSKSIEANPQYDQAHHNMGMALVQKGQLDAAVEQFKDSIDIDPRFCDAYNKLGAALASQHKFDEAIDNFHKALDIDPNYGSAYANLGSALELQGHTREALENYYRALRLPSSNTQAAQINYRVGNLLAKDGKESDAADYYRQALRLKPDYGPAQQALSQISKSE